MVEGVFCRPVRVPLGHTGSNHLAFFQESVVRRALLQVVFPDALEGDVERYLLLRGQIPAIPYLK